MTAPGWVRRLFRISAPPAGLLAPGPFVSDWTLAPVRLLDEWLIWHPGNTLAAPAGLDAGDRHLLAQVQRKEPLTGQHAAFLETHTGIPAVLWLDCERRYREDLTRGAKDLTDAT